MEFRQIESFISIAKYKSFSKAAKQLYLTQPTLSTHIQSLEEELDTLLFDRSTKQLCLTKAGEIFYDYARDLIFRKEELLMEVGSFTGRLHGTLHIHASTVPEQYLLPTLLKGFLKDYPDLQVKVNHLDSFDILHAIKDQRIDFGFSGAEPKDPQLESIPLFEDEMILVCSPNFSRADEPITSKDLSSLPLIIREYGSGTRDLFAKELKKKKISLRDLHLRIQSESLELIKSLVIQNEGCAILSKISVQKEIDKKILCTIPISDMELKRYFYLVYPKARSISPIHQTFIAYVKKSEALWI